MIAHIRSLLSLPPFLHQSLSITAHRHSLPSSLKTSAAVCRLSNRRSSTLQYFLRFFSFSPLPPWIILFDSFSVPVVDSHSLLCLLLLFYFYLFFYFISREFPSDLYSPNFRSSSSESALEVRASCFGWLMVLNIYCHLFVLHFYLCFFRLFAEFPSPFSLLVQGH